MVQDIERIRAQGHFPSVIDRELLLHRQVDVEEVRTVENVAALIAVSPWRRDAKWRGRRAQN